MSKRIVTIVASFGALFVTFLLLPHRARPQQITANAFITSPMTVRTTADRTMSSGTLSTIMGLTWTLPSLPAAQAYSFHCAGSYNQSATVGASQFGLQVGSGSIAASNWEATGVVQTGGSFVGGVSKGQTTTTATPVVSFTPSGPANLTWQMDGTIENKANQSLTVNIEYLNGGTMSTVIYRGSFCAITP